jgi:hypothetical protein
MVGIIATAVITTMAAGTIVTKQKGHAKRGLFYA